MNEIGSKVKLSNIIMCTSSSHYKSSFNGWNLCWILCLNLLKLSSSTGSTQHIINFEKSILKCEIIILHFVVLTTHEYLFKIFGSKFCNFNTSMAIKNTIHWCIIIIRWITNVCIFLNKLLGIIILCLPYLSANPTSRNRHICDFFLDQSKYPLKS